MLERNLKQNIERALADTPVVVLQGPRQCGKTTLVKEIAIPIKAHYFTLDDFTTLSLLKEDPLSFLRNLEGPIILDEVQRAPDTLLAIKNLVDTHRVPGKFLLTGSTSILSLRTLADSLAGRMEILTLWPLSQGERDAHKGTFIDDAFANRLPQQSDTRLFKESMIFEGGFPEAVSRNHADRRRAWFSSYLTSVIQKDIRDLSNIEGFSDIPALTRVLATRIGNLFNAADISRVVKIPTTTLKRYIALLEATFMIKFIYPWHTNLRQRMVKAPKVFFCDTGLVSYLLGLNEKQALQSSMFIGSLLENFVAVELMKQSTWSQVQPQIYHYRTQDQKEIDFILENGAGDIVAIEVKHTASPSSTDLATLKKLAIEMGPRLKKGILLYTGSKILPVTEVIGCYPIASIY